MDIYTFAMQMERDGETYYRELGEKSRNVGLKRIFTMLARKEDKHYRIMDNLVEFVSKPEPGNWLENAEWHHLENY